MPAVALGYHLSAEEHPAADLVRYAQVAEAAGFSFAFISDHFHPWLDRQGQSPFVWTVLGAIAQVTERLILCTGVTCPTMRIHPAIVAQAAATTAAVMPGRFVLGLGSGERLNEHVLGGHWPPLVQRQQMLAEAIEVIRKLWTGDLVTHRGRHFTVESAQLYGLPAELPRIFLAAGGPNAAELAGRVADGIIGATPDAELVKTFAREGGDKPRWGQFKVCWGPTEAAARRTAREWWPVASLPGVLGLELPLPRDFEDVASLVTEDQVAASILCGPDPDLIVSRVHEFVDAGFHHVAIHQVGPDQDAFIRFAEREVIPRFAE